MTFFFLISASTSKAYVEHLLLFCQMKELSKQMADLIMEDGGLGVLFYCSI